MKQATRGKMKKSVYRCFEREVYGLQVDLPPGAYGGLAYYKLIRALPPEDGEERLWEAVSDLVDELLSRYPETEDLVEELLSLPAEGEGDWEWRVPPREEDEDTPISLFFKVDREGRISAVLCLLVED